jgi:kinetochore protein Nuf2
VRIEQTEKKACTPSLSMWLNTMSGTLTMKQMVDLKENIENEIHNAHDEFLKMDSHIKLYITEMEQSI